MTNSDYYLLFDIDSKRRRISVQGRLAPTTCEWSQIARDISDYFVVNNDDEQSAEIQFSDCSFLATTPTCPGWLALLQQLRRIEAHASSLRVIFVGCAFASEDMRQSLAQAWGQMDPARVQFEDCSSVQPASFGSEQMTRKMCDIVLEVHETEEDGRSSFYVKVDNNEHCDSFAQSVTINTQPTSRQWQGIATFTASNNPRNADPMTLSFCNTKFRHSAGLEILWNTFVGIAVDPITGTIRRRMNFNLDACEFVDAEAVHSIGMALASNKGVQIVNLREIDGQPLCNLWILLSQSTTLRKVEIPIPRKLEHRDCICKGLAVSTGLVSVIFRQPFHDNADYTEFVRDVRSSVVAAAFKTRGKYRNWDTLSVKDLPYHCEYVQFGMPRLIVTAMTFHGDSLYYDDDAQTSDLYRLTVLYDMLKSCNAVLQQLRSNVVESVPKCGKRKFVQEV